MFKILNPFGKALTHSDGDRPLPFDSVDDALAFIAKYEPYRGAFWAVPFEHPAKLSGSWFE